MKKHLILFLVGVLVVSIFFMVISCKTEVAEETTEEVAEEVAEETTEEVAEEVAEETPLVIGEIMFELSHPYQQAHAKWAEMIAEEYGIEIIIVDGKSDPAAVATGMEDLISRGVDGIIVQPVDAAAINASISEAHAAGIPVVAWAIPPTEANQPFVELSEANQSFAMGQTAANKWMEIFPNEPIKIGAINFHEVEMCTGQRTGQFVEGVLDAASTAGIDAELVADLNGGGIRDKSLAAGEDMLQSNPEVNIIYGCNDDSSLGALAAFEAAGRGLAVDGVPVSEIFVGTGGSEAEVLKIADPNSALKLSMALSPGKHARDCIDLLLQVINGEIEMTSDYILPTEVIILNGWEMSIDDLEAFIKDQYFSETDLREAIGL